MSLIQEINRTISTVHMQQLNFTVEGRNVTPSIYQPVRDKISDGTITARRHGPAGVRGAWVYTPNRFDMGFEEVSGDTFKAALVVHESTHAAFDYINQPMTVKVSEALAYIAQALWFYHDNKAHFDDNGTVELDEPFSTAFTVSAPARGGAHTFTGEELAPLYAALESDSLYQGRGDDDAGNDGIA